MADKNKQGEFYSRPKEMGKWEGFTKFVWNKETNEVLGRTGCSWAKILLFYVIFYAALAGFFALIFTVFYQTLDENKPKWRLSDGLIGTNPGLGFRPMPPDEHVESTLVWFEASNDKNVEHWITALNDFTKVYHDKSDAEAEKNRVACDSRTPPKEGKVCRVNLDQGFGLCTKDNSYGYPRSKPCIFLKLNKIYDWIPEFFNETTELPDLMPDDLKSHITDSSQNNQGPMIWVSCEGENPADIENMGPIHYLPNRGFPGYYFPFKNQKGYMPPILAINFERPKTGVLINIECKAWARNIIHDRTERRGSVHFELMVD